MNEQDDLQRISSLWSQQNSAMPELTPEEAQKKAAAFDRTIRFRNLREYGACGILIPIFLRMSFHALTLWSALMHLEIVFACCFVAYVLFKSSRNQKPPSPTAATVQFLQHHKQQLTKQIQLLSKVRYWYVLPLLFGLVGLNVEYIFVNFKNGESVVRPVLNLAIVCLIGWGIVYLNEVKVVKALRDELDRLF